MEDIAREGEVFPAFPFPPYEIQLGFMRALYKALEEGGVGLFESPTGTGKTLSLICGSLQWLEDHRRREAAAAAAPAAGPPPGDDQPDWMRDFTSQQASQRQVEHKQRHAKRLAKAKAKLGQRAPPLSGHDGAAAPALDSQGGDAEYLVGEWTSDPEGEVGRSGAGSKRPPPAPRLSDSDDSASDSGVDEDEELEPPRKTQIIFCSRTHSQLSQFVGELHRTPFSDSMSLVALGSRRSLCINDTVLRLATPALINERCLELQKLPAAKKKAAGAAGFIAPSAPRPGKASGRCPYLASGSKATDTTRDMILAHPVDVEDLARLGRRRSVCAYYAARRAVPEADVVLVPYSALLVKEARRSLGLRVEGAVIIVDEGHNLVDAINNSHSAELTAATASVAQRQLGAYFDRFKMQLTPANARNIQALMCAAAALAKAASNGGHPSSSEPASGGGGKAHTVNDFAFSVGLDNVNMFKLVTYARETKAVFKIAGFCQAAAQRAAAAAAKEAAVVVLGGRRRSGGAAPPASVPGSLAANEGATGALHSLVAFLQALTNDDADGRIVVDPGAGTLRFVLLNAAAHFAEVVSAARAVVLASGTLSPLESVLHLFPATPPASIHRYTCGHVVGRERLLALAVGLGPSGAVLDFRHTTRGAPATMDELGRLVANVCAATPGGVVVFFPSFSYADQVHAHWVATGALHALGTRKEVFREPRASGEVEPTLEAYARCIERCAEGSGGGRQQTGAVMLCVVGGKLCEGINFGDALGRCVVMVGLPFPNASDPELQERLKYIDRTAEHAAPGPPPSREHYQNLCMKAVNQCVGRVIRHKGDYAAILLVDARYVAGVDASGRHSGAVAKLPDWIRQSLVASPRFGDAYGRVVRFFKAMAMKV